MSRREWMEEERLERERDAAERGAPDGAQEDAALDAPVTLASEVVVLDALDVDDDRLKPPEGYVLVKRAVRADGSRNEVHVYSIPVTTEGLEGYMRQLVEGAPKPPVRERWVDPKSDFGKEMGITKPQGCAVADYTDETYQRKMAEHSEKMVRRSVAHCIAIPLFYRTESGEKKRAETPEEKAKAMIQQGFSQGDLKSIGDQIGRLMSWTEDEQRHFFGVS